MAYLGAQISLMAFFGKIRFKVSIDLGFGDKVKEIRQDLSLLRTPKGPLFEESISLNCYPKEYIFAEKLETVIYRRGANSRMKDFHDLYTMIGEQESPDIKTLKDAIETVFTHRQTPITIPVQFVEEEIKSLEEYWFAYHKELNHTNLSPSFPSSLKDLVEILNVWLKKVELIN